MPFIDRVAFCTPTLPKTVADCFAATDIRHKNTEYQRSRNDHSPMSDHGAYANHLLYLDEPGGFARSAGACVKGCPEGIP